MTIREARADTARHQEDVDVPLYARDAIQAGE
jgi:hypothetical protein